MIGMPDIKMTSVSCRTDSRVRWAAARPPQPRWWGTRPRPPCLTANASPPPTAGWWTSTRWSRVKPTKPNLRQVCSPAFTCVCKEGTAYNERLGRWVILIPYITSVIPTASSFSCWSHLRSSWWTSWQSSWWSYWWTGASSTSQWTAPASHLIVCPRQSWSAIHYFEYFDHVGCEAGRAIDACIRSPLLTRWWQRMQQSALTESRWKYKWYRHDCMIASWWLYDGLMMESCPGVGLHACLHGAGVVEQELHKGAAVGGVLQGRWRFRAWIRNWRKLRRSAFYCWGGDDFILQKKIPSLEGISWACASLLDCGTMIFILLKMLDTSTKVLGMVVSIFLILLILVCLTACICYCCRQVGQCIIAMVAIELLSPGL